MTAAVLLVGLVASPLTPAAGGPLDLEPEDLKPGLVAEYRSLADPKATVARIEPKPAFALGRSSPHPRRPRKFSICEKNLGVGAGRSG